MRRREFITLASSAAIAWPLAARAQQPAQRTIGWLTAGSRPSSNPTGFRQGLSETGYVEGKNLTIEYRWADGQYDRLQALAADLVRSQVAVIVTVGGPQVARAAQASTSTIPIVFRSGSDPVQDGLVKSLNRPGGNTTGFHVFTTNLGPKRLELLRELIPNVSVIAFLVNPSSQISEMQIAQVQDAARTVGQRVFILNASTESEIDLAFETLAERAAAGALLMSADLFFQVRRDQLVALEARYKVPVMYEWPEFVAAGGLISYSAARTDWLQTGIYVGRLLNGAKPADLPVVRSTSFELVINLKTAKLHGLEIPPGLLARADEVIE